MANMQALAKRRALSRPGVPTQPDPRGMTGIMSRGANIYNGGSRAAVSGPQGPGFGRPPMRMPNRGMGQQQSSFALPYDPAYAERLRDIAARRAGLQSDYGMAQQRIGEDTSLSEHNLAQTREDALNSLMQRLADQGTLYSGINIGEQGKIGQEYQSELANLQQGQTRSLEDLLRQYTAGQQGLQSEQEQALYSRIRDAVPALLERAMGEAQGQANAQWLQQQGLTPITYSPTGKVTAQPGRMPPPAIPPRSIGNPAGRQPAPRKKAAIRPTKGAVKRKVTRSK